jgi:hypothetical protein
VRLLCEEKQLLTDIHQECVARIAELWADPDAKPQAWKDAREKCARALNALNSHRMEHGC